MPMFENVSGTWKEIPSPSERVSGTWKQITGGWENVAGTWKRFFDFLTITLVSDATYGSVGANFGNGPCSAGLRVRRNGNIQRGSSNSSTTPSYTDFGGDPNHWADPPSSTVGDGFHVRFLRSSGSLSVGTDNTWLALTSDRTIEVNANSGGSAQWEGRVQLSDDGGSSVLEESGVFTISASSSTI